MIISSWISQHYPEAECDVVKNRQSQKLAPSLGMLRISVMVISRSGERDQCGRWCCAVNGLYRR